MKTPIQHIDIIIVTFTMSLSLFLLSIAVWGETIPEMYDLRTVNGNCFITSIKNQGDYGDCWSFSAVAAMESNLLKQGFGSLDLSELEIGYYASHTASPSRPGLEGDKTILVDYYDGTYLDAGGFPHYVTQLMANGYGVTTEKILPHPTSGKPPRSIDNIISYKDNQYTVRNIDWVSMKKMASVKSHIMKYGAADAGFEIYLDSKGNPDYYWNKDTNSYYLSDSGYQIANRCGNIGGHAVAIIGWNDNYSKNNFGGKRGIKPAQNGAWLCKNSWGTGSEYCEDGFFWISYEDASLSNSSVSFYEMTPVTKSNNDIYQYDGSLSETYLKSKHNKLSESNIFCSRKTETLHSVGFLQHSDNLSYAIQVYINPKAGTPTSGKRVMNKEITGTSTSSGYHVIPLPKRIRLKKKTHFAVVITLKSKSNKRFRVPIDDNMTLPYDEKRDYIRYVSRSKPGQSFLKDGSKWKDLSKSGHINLRIKAYTY